MHAFADSGAREGELHDEGGLVAEAHFFLLLECKRPLAGAARYSLAGVNEVTVGRGAARFVVREGGRLEIRVPDPAMSTDHARLFRTASGWTIEDDGSTNGTLVGGQLVESEPLDDGALVELGTTFFSLRAAMPTPRSVQADLESRDLFDGSEGLSTLVPEYAQHLRRLRARARSARSMLLLGESGTGKEVLARALHAESRRLGPFVTVNCSAIPAASVESQLFGHFPGSVSDARNHGRNQQGLLRAADRGTLFLDEIGDLPQASQAALLRVLEEGAVSSGGGAEATNVDLHVISATQRQIDTRAGAESFHPDLFARLAGFRVALSPLRERREDLGLLIAELLPRIAPGRAGSLELSVELGRALFDYDWPLNVRELKHCLSAAVVFATGGVLELTHAPVGLRAPATRQPAVGDKAIALDAESSKLRDGIVVALTRSRGNVSQAARAMGRTRTQIHRWMRRFGIDPGVHRV